MGWKERLTPDEGQQALDKVSEEVDQAKLQELRSKLDPLAPEVLLEGINQQCMQGQGEIVEVGRVSKGTYSEPHPLRQGETVYFNDTYAGYALVRIDRSSIDQHNLTGEGATESVRYDGVAIGCSKTGRLFVSSNKQAVFRPDSGYEFGLSKGQRVPVTAGTNLRDIVQKQLTAAVKELEGE